VPTNANVKGAGSSLLTIGKNLRDKQLVANLRAGGASAAKEQELLKGTISGTAAWYHLEFRPVAS
jgi:hypothetical protein